MTNTFGRLFSMYSFYLMLVAYSKLWKPQWLPQSLWDVVAANTVIVACIVLMFYILYGLNEVKSFYDNLFSVSLPIWVWVIIDMFVHFIPVIVVGIPHQWWSYWAAFAMLFAFFQLTKHRFDRVYAIKAVTAQTAEKALIKIGIPFVAIVSFLTWALR